MQTIGDIKPAASSIKRRVRLSDQDRYDIVEVRLHGASITVLAGRFNCSSEAIRQVLLKAQGTPGGRLNFRADRRRDVCAKRDARIRCVATSAGAGTQRVSDMLGLPVSVVRRAICSGS